MLENLTYFIPGIVVGMLMINRSLWTSWCFFWTTLLSSYLTIWGIPGFVGLLGKVPENELILVLQIAYIVIFFALIIIFFISFKQIGPDVKSRISFPKIIEKIFGFISGFVSSTIVVAMLLLVSSINLPFYKSWCTPARYKLAKQILINSSMVVDFAAGQNSYLDGKSQLAGIKNDVKQSSKIRDRRSVWYDDLASTYMENLSFESMTTEQDTENTQADNGKTENVSAPEVAEAPKETSKAVLTTQRTVSYNPRKLASKATNAAAKNQSAATKLSK